MNEVELLNIDLRDIDFGDRARKTYKDLDVLARDFKEKGVISPIAVKRVLQVEEGQKPFFLLAGGRRYSAAVFGEFESIPARVYPSDLSELDYREIELMENVSRADLDWKEEVWLTEEIHRLEVSKHGEAAGPSEGHSAADTADLLGKSAMSVSRDRQLAAGLEKHGEVLEGAKNRSEALRTLKRIERKEVEEVVSRDLQEKIKLDQGDSTRKALVNSYILGDFFERILDVPNSAVHVIEIDPPYAIDLKNIKYGKRDDLETYNEVEEEAYPEFLETLFRECYRVMFPSGWLICWHAIQYYPLVKSLLEEAGFSTEKIPAIWNKGITGQTHNPELRLGSSYEPFIYARKGSPTIYQPGRSNVFNFKPIHSEHKVHPTERPIEMIQEVLKTFSAPNNRVLVPFLGSGNTLLAAANYGMNGFGFDLSEEYRNSFMSKVDKDIPPNYKSYP